MGKDNVALEGVFNPDITIRDIVAKVRTTLESRYTSIDSTEQLLARMDTDRNEIKQLILDISNVMAQVHNGAMSKTDAIDEVRPMVKQLKSECVALKLVDELSPDDDICETELQMLSEAITQIHAAVEDHLNTLKANEGSDRDGRAGTIADGAQTETTGSATESLYQAMMSGNTLACESIMRSDNMPDTSVMAEMLAMEADDGATAPAADDAKKKGEPGKLKGIWDAFMKKLGLLIEKMKTWLARMIQRARSVRVEVTPAGRKYISAANAASMRAAAAANTCYATALKVAVAAKNGNTVDESEVEKAAEAVSEVKKLVETAMEAKKAAKISIKNVPVEVLDKAMGAVRKIEDVKKKLQQNDDYILGGSATLNMSLKACRPLYELLPTLQNMIGSNTEEQYGSNEAAAKDRDKAQRLTNEKKADKAVTPKEPKAPKEKDNKEKPAAESYDAIAMARAAAAEGNLEGVVESLLLAMDASHEVSTAEEGIDMSEFEELDSAMECTMLELELLDTDE